MDERKEPYIEQQPVEDTLYTKLQAQTLDEVQRLAGKVWTDYNVHDPGITVGDATNHALAELDYKLGFPLADYCTEKDGLFSPRRFGLFPPEDAYTTQPVTVEDYRRLFLANIPDIDDVHLVCDTKTGGYTIRILPSPFRNEKADKVCEEVKTLYHRYRNLCEFLSGEVEILKPDELEFQAEFEIDSGEDATDVLARVYAAILDYLSGEVRISMPDETAVSAISPEEWLEGMSGIVRPVLSEGKRIEHELYKRLRAVKGVRSFTTCYLMKNGIPQTDFSQGFGLHIPEREDELRVCIRQEHDQTKPIFVTFLKRLEVLYQSNRRRIPAQEELRKEYHWSMPEAVYRDIFAHDSVLGDFPACYRLSEAGKPGKSVFENYLALYDRVIEDGLKEVEGLPGLLSLKANEAGKLDSRHIREAKKQYLDFLDKLYGVESNPAWLAGQNRYGETEEGMLCRRMNFLSHAAYLTRNRSRARNILPGEAGSGAAVVKEWFCHLLGLDSSDEHFVGNVLPKYNLRIVEKRKRRTLVERMDSLLMDERMLEEDMVEPVRYEELASDEAKKLDEYNEMREELEYFNENRISGDLFRGGTVLARYRTVQFGAEEYILLYRNQERDGYTNLGRADSRERLNRMANILRRFLRELNRACETVYIMEPVLADTDRAFRLMLVFPNWTGRFHSDNFRAHCEELLRELLPAHLAIDTYWLGESGMKKFENYYRQWIRSLTDRRMGNYKKQLLQLIDELLHTEAEKEIQDDTDRPHIV